MVFNVWLFLVTSESSRLAVLAGNFQPHCIKGNNTSCILELIFFHAASKIYINSKNNMVKAFFRLVLSREVTKVKCHVTVIFFFCSVKNDCDNNLIMSLIEKCGLCIVPKQQHHLLSAEIPGPSESKTCFAMWEPNWGLRQIM